MEEQLNSRSWIKKRDQDLKLGVLSPVLPWYDPFSWNITCDLVIQHMLPKDFSFHSSQQCGDKDLSTPWAHSYPPAHSTFLLLYVEV